MSSQPPFDLFAKTINSFMFMLIPIFKRIAICLFGGLLRATFWLRFLYPCMQESSRITFNIYFRCFIQPLHSAKSHDLFDVVTVFYIFFYIFAFILCSLKMYILMCPILVDIYDDIHLNFVNIQQRGPSFTALQQYIYD